MTHVLSFEEAEQALKEACLARARKYVEEEKAKEAAQRLRRSFSLNDALHAQRRADLKRRQAVAAWCGFAITTYTDEIAELFQEMFGQELAEFGAVYSPPYFPHPHEDGVGDVGDTDCGVCYACTTMDGPCVDEQPTGTYLDWHRGQVKEALKRWA